MPPKHLTTDVTAYLYFYFYDLNKYQHAAAKVPARPHYLMKCQRWIRGRRQKSSALTHLWHTLWIIEWRNCENHQNLIVQSKNVLFVKAWDFICRSWGIKTLPDWTIVLYFSEIPGILEACQQCAGFTSTCYKYLQHPNCREGFFFPLTYIGKL